MNTTDKNKKPIKRRSFLKRLWVAAGIVAGLEFIYIAFNFLQPKKTSKEALKKTFYNAGSLEDFKKNSITSFRNRSFFLCRTKNGDFHALSSRCTHLGCALNYNKEKHLLECPCHSSIFDINGKVLKSPASKSLPKLEVVIEKGVVRVNTSSILSLNSVHSNHTHNC